MINYLDLLDFKSNFANENENANDFGNDFESAKLRKRKLKPLNRQSKMEEKKRISTRLTFSFSKDDNGIELMRILIETLKENGFKEQGKTDEGDLRFVDEAGTEAIVKTI